MAIDYRTVRAKVKRATPRQVKAAALLANGETSIRSAMKAAGYSEWTADAGMRAVPATVLALMPQESNLIDLGRAVTPEQQENMVRGRLMLNVMKGRDAGVNSAYRLGQDKRVNMFQADSQVGVVIIQSPQSDKSEVPEE